MSAGRFETCPYRDLRRLPFNRLFEGVERRGGSTFVDPSLQGMSSICVSLNPRILLWSNAIHKADRRLVVSRLLSGPCGGSLVPVEHGSGTSHVPPFVRRTG